MANRLPNERLDAVYDLEPTAKQRRYVCGLGKRKTPELDQCGRVQKVDASAVVINHARTPTANSVVEDNHPTGASKLLKEFDTFRIVLFLDLLIVGELGVLGRVAIVLESGDIKTKLMLLPAYVFDLDNSDVFVPVLWSFPSGWVDAYVGKGSGTISGG